MIHGHVTKTATYFAHEFEVWGCSGEQLTSALGCHGHQLEWHQWPIQWKSLFSLGQSCLRDLEQLFSFTAEISLPPQLTFTCFLHMASLVWCSLGSQTSHGWFRDPGLFPQTRVTLEIPKQQQQNVSWWSKPLGYSNSKRKELNSSALQNGVAQNLFSFSRTVLDFSLSSTKPSKTSHWFSE